MDGYMERTQQYSHAQGSDAAGIPAHSAAFDQTLSPVTSLIDIQQDIPHANNVREDDHPDAPEHNPSSKETSSLDGTTSTSERKQSGTACLYCNSQGKKCDGLFGQRCKRCTEDRTCLYVRPVNRPEDDGDLVGLEKTVIWRKGWSLDALPAYPEISPNYIARKLRMHAIAGHHAAVYRTAPGCFIVY
ncbi:hypothetical protein OBBRIDRAFT_889550 [Obba rivulosa]|uniref:Zn(2)-C6 fungal-type domain-containing protein n=1 Tax=Obba rivulosa TaxID=1052685 RepID=A0A8E2ANA1_9APHY|nr:hypothetical protein OBBRIDRAFT_889550 [Obba rivulosa]